MNMYFRFLILILKRLFSFQRLDPFQPCHTKFRVNPFDLDINLHMNNGRYLTIMDLGRMDLLMKAGLFWRLIFQGYYPVVVSESIRFKKSLEPFHAFELITLIESWDEKDFFIIQKFLHGKSVVAEGYIKGRFKQRGRKGSVPTAEIFDLLGRAYPGAQISSIAEAQTQIENHLVRDKT